MSNAHRSSSSITTTQAAVINQYGGPEQLVAAEVALPEPTDAQVAVDVAAISVNPVDLTTRAGRNIAESGARFPMVLGWDVAGTVRAVGSGISDLQVGDRVAAMVFQPIDQRGTYAARVVLNGELVARVPDRLSLQQAATVPLAGLTASQLLDQVAVDGVTSLLVTGPLGAVGRHVVALAARAGLQVVGAAAAERNDELVALGGVEAVGRGDFTAAVRARYPDGVDAAIDLVGGPTSHAAFDAVRDGGRYVTAVPPYVDGSGRFEAVRGVDLHVLTVQPDTGRLTELLALAEEGVLTSTIEASFPLADAARAHERQAAGGLVGRVVLLP